MRISSVFLDLPTPPFTSSNSSVERSTKQNALFSQGGGLGPGGAHNLASRSAETSNRLLQIGNQLTPLIKAAQSAGELPNRQDELNLERRRGRESTPTGFVSIAPRPKEPSTSMPQCRQQPPFTMPAVRPVPPMPSAAAKPPAVRPLRPLRGYFQAAEHTSIVPRTQDIQSTSMLQSRTQLQSISSVGSAPSSLVLKYRPQGVAPAQLRKRVLNGKRGKKRKRRDSDSESESVVKAGDSSSDESDITPTATQTKSGRQVNRPSIYKPPIQSPGINKDSTGLSNVSAGATIPAGLGRKRKRIYRRKKEIYVSCTYCQRTNSPLTNTIVFCDQCDKAWHQLCHNPPIDNEFVTVKEKEWVCRECNPISSEAVYATTAEITQPVQPPGPPIRSPVSTPQLVVGGAGHSKDARRAYLSSLSHATLVELLMSLSDNNPSSFTFPPSIEPHQSSTLSHQPNMLNNFPPAVPVGPSGRSSAERGMLNTASLNTSTTEGHNDESSDESEYENVEDHRLYPRPGNGFRPPLSDNDLDILREDPACPTFSYSLRGAAKFRIEANETAPIWGTT